MEHHNPSTPFNTIIENHLLDFYFSLGRVSLDSKREPMQYRLLTILMTKFDKIVYYVKQGLDTQSSTEKPSQYIEEIFELSYHLILFTRDVCCGMGERTLCYMMLFIWHKYFPIHALSILANLPQPQPDNHPPIGSWRDIPEFCTFVKHFVGEACPIIDTCIGIMNHQLDLDLDILCKHPSQINTSLSLVSKWIPRENSRHGWLYDRFVIQWMNSVQPDYFTRCKNTSEELTDEERKEKFDRAMNHARSEYRRTVSRVCSHLESVQTKQCTNQWKSIATGPMSLMTLMRQKYALLNVFDDRKPRLKTHGNIDRESCKEIFQAYYDMHTDVSGNLNPTPPIGHTIFRKKHAGGLHLGELVRHIVTDVEYGNTLCEPDDIAMLWNMEHQLLMRCIRDSLSRISDSDSDSSSSDYKMDVDGESDGESAAAADEESDDDSVQNMSRVIPVLDMSLFGAENKYHSSFMDSMGIACMIAQCTQSMRIAAYNSCKNTPMWINLDAYRIDVADTVADADSETNVDVSSTVLDADVELERIACTKQIRGLLSHVYETAREFGGRNLHGNVITTAENELGSPSHMTSACNLICTGLVQSNTSADTVKNMILLVLSPFSGGLSQLMTIHSTEIVPMFHRAGFPHAPHMVYWNMSGGNDAWSVHNPPASETSGNDGYTLLAGGSSSILRFLIHLQKAKDWKQLTSFELLKLMCGREPTVQQSLVG